MDSPGSSHPLQRDSQGLHFGDYRKQASGDDNRLYDLHGNFVVLGTIKESDVYRSLKLPPPFPVSLFNSLDELSAKILLHLDRKFVSRPRSKLFLHGEVDTQIKSPFRRKSPPSIPVEDYFCRIRNYLTALEPTMLLSLLIYAHRLDPPLSEGNAGAEKLRIDAFSIHRFIITSICLASKAMGDYYYSNLYYAKIGGVSNLELNGLELDLTEKLGWRLQCTRRELAKCWNELEQGLTI